MTLPESLSIDAATRRVHLSPSDPSFFQDPATAYAALHAAGLDAFFWEDYGHWCFAGHASVSALFRDRRLGREITHLHSRDELGWPPLEARLASFYELDAHSMLEREPPAHTRLRTLVNRAFVSRTVERLRPRIAALAHELVDALPADAPVDLLEHFATPIPVTIIAELLGVPTTDAPRLLDWSHRMVAMYRFNRTRADEDAAVAATQAFVSYLGTVVTARRRTPGDDILSLLIAAESAGDRLSGDELIATAILLLNAGHEATVHAIGNAVAAILMHRLDPSTVFATPGKTASAVEELLRFSPPLHMFTRYVLQPIRLDGVSFAVGDTIGLLIGAANRDPRAYVLPERLLPDREGPPHAAFGAGIHFCVGAPLARLELGVALPILFARCPNLRLAAAPLLADRYHFSGLSELRVIAGRH